MTVDIRDRPAEQRHEHRTLAAFVAIVILVGSAVLLARAYAPPPAGDASVAQKATATALDDRLQRRFEAAASAARAYGVTLTITSGWRSAAEQQRIIAGYVTASGSVAEAHRWALPPDKSAHVQGLAIDVGPPAGAAWLAEHGAQFGLCRTYANEAWHFEPVVGPGGTCPAPHQDSSWGW